MSRQDKEIADKILALALAFILVLEVIPLRLHAADIAGHDSYVTTRETSSAQPSEGPLQPENKKKVTVDNVPQEGGKITLADTEMTQELNMLTVDAGSKVVLQVIPQEGYHIGSIFIGDESKDVENPAESYTEEITVDDDVTIKVEFALNEFSVQAYTDGNGEVKVSQGTVKYGGDICVTVKPKENYIVKNIVFGSLKPGIEGQTISVSDLKKNYKYEENNNDNTLKFKIENIKENKEIYVEFSSINKSTKKISDLIRDKKLTIEEMDGYTDKCIYTTKETVKIKAAEGMKFKIKLNEDDYEGWLREKEISSDCVIKGIQLKSAYDNLDVVDDEINVITNYIEPSINLSIEEENDAASGYYTSRKVKISVKDESGTVDLNELKAAVYIEDFNTKFNTKKNMTDKVEWTDWSYDKKNGIHTATLTFSADANYRWKIKDNYTDKAGNKPQIKNVNNINNIWEFAVDNTAPTASIKVDKDEHVWSKIIDTLTFGIFKNEKYTINIKAEEDAVSGINEIAYYVCRDGKLLKAEELENIYSEGGFLEYNLQNGNGVELDCENEAFVVYARITDKAGNVNYTSTDGLVMDSEAPEITIESTTKPAGMSVSGRYIYDKDVDLKITVSDTVSNGISGIDNITYKISSGNNIEEEGTLYNKDDKSGIVEVVEEKSGERLTKSVITGHVEVKAGTFNADGVKVEVTATDNAGNKQKKDIYLNINTTTPLVTFSFLDEDTEPVYTDEDTEHGYFSFNRKATLTYVDRDSSFDKKNAIEGINITADGKPIDTSGMIGEFKSKDGKHTIEINFEETATYKVDIKYKNKAGKPAEVSYEGTTPQLFTIDLQNPYGAIKIGKNKYDELPDKLPHLVHIVNDVLEVKIEANDAHSGIEEVSYFLDKYKRKRDKPRKAGELDDLYADDRFIPLDRYEDGSFEKIHIESGAYVIYVRISDDTGNVKYIGSDGVIVDDTKSKITLKPEKTDKNGIYNKDVRVGIEVKEPETYSGIKCIKYWAMCDSEKTQEGILYNEDNMGNVPSYSDLKQEWQGNVVVDSKKNNSSDLFLYVKVEDNAGNTSIKRIKLDIDVSKPKIEVSYDNNEDNGGNGYFKKDRTATIKIRERKNHFNAKEATAGIKITAVNGKGKAVKLPEMVSKWTSISGDTADETVHVAKIKYSADANYTFKINYTDKAGNKNSAVDTGISKSPYKFTIDKKMPVGAVTAVTAEGRKESWSSLAGRLTFGIWSKQSIKLSAVTDDATSPVAKVMYYKTDSTKAMTRRQLAKIKKWKTFRTMSVGEDEQFTVYLKIIDKAGNENYISTNGMIVDDTAPRAEAIAPEVTVTPEQPVNGIYSKDVNVGITVSDPVSGGTYSGLKTVSYRVLNMGEETQSGVLYSFDKESPLQNELQQSWSGGITVNSSLNNSNDVVIEVYAEDNSLNSSTKSEKIKIDTTKPLINVSYDNNLPDSGKYYKEARTATIVISERNFDAKDVEVSITNTDGTIPVVSGWTTAEGNGNMDNTTHTATVTYEADGDYTFDINYTDLAGNICDGESYAPGTENPVEFTIDKILPEVSVSYNNNSAANGRYFKEARTATVTVREHNFDAGRVQFTQTAVLNGTPIASPVPSWSSSGDIHTATILYTQDGDYTFDVSMSDMAGNQVSGVNYGSDISAKEFTVDTHIDVPVITGIEDGKAYKGDVVPEIDFSDINYNNYKVTLTRTRMSEKNVDVTEQFIKEAEVNQQGGSIKNSIFDAVQENDGIYNLTVHTDDKAGNESETSVVFTLNRFGSVYAYDDYLISLIQDGGAYVKSVDNDLVVTEYNADRLVDGSLNIEITHDGKPINDIIYETSPAINSNVSVGDSGWFEYVYTVSKENFAEDGIYKMSVSSRDEAGNNPENTNYEDKDIRFCVDTAAPELTSIVGLDKKVVNATQLNVKYDVYDTIGLKSVKVYVDGDLEGSEITDFSNDYNNYSGDFTLKESGTARKVRFVVEDLAGNITDTDSEDFSSAYAFTKEVTVSTNAFIRWYANKKLFWGTIVFAVVAVGGISGIIVIKRRKKNQA